MNFILFQKSSKSSSSKRWILLYFGLPLLLELCLLGLAFYLGLESANDKASMARPRCPPLLPVSCLPLGAASSFFLPGGPLANAAERFA